MVSVYTPLPPSSGGFGILGARKNRHASRNPNSPLEGGRGVFWNLALPKNLPLKAPNPSQEGNLAISSRKNLPLKGVGRGSERLPQV